MRPSRVLCGLAVAVVLTSCGQQQPTSPSSPTHDWRNATYTLTCDGVVPQGFSATLHDGDARAPGSGDYDAFVVHLVTTASGDLDGDGRPDTVVLLQCSPQPSNGIVEEVQVFDADAHLMAGLPSPRTLPHADVLSPVYDRLSVEDGVVVARMGVYEPTDTHAGGPSGSETLRWRWTGSHFENVP